MDIVMDIIMDTEFNARISMLKRAIAAILMSVAGIWIMLIAIITQGIVITKDIVFAGVILSTFICNIITAGDFIKKQKYTL